MASEKMVTIYINSRKHEWPKAEISFQDVVDLYNADQSKPPQPNTTYTITYTKGHNDKPTGKLTSGGSVKVKDEMRFNVDATIES